MLEKIRVFIYNVFCRVISNGKEKRMKGYLSIREISCKWGIEPYCTQGCIPGAERFGHSWAIPEDAEKPTDLHNGNGNRSRLLK